MLYIKIYPFKNYPRKTGYFQKSRKSWKKGSAAVWKNVYLYYKRKRLFYCMRKTVFILVFLISTVIAKGQVEKGDSLIKLLPAAKEDTNKANLLFAIGEQYENSEPEKAKYYIRLASDLSKKINYEKGILKSYRLFSYVYAYQSKFDSVIYYNKLVLEIARQRKDTFNIGVSLFNIGIAYRYISDLESALQYTIDGVNILGGKGYDNIEVNLNDGLQSLYMSLMQYDKAIQYGTKAVELGRKLKDKTPLLNVLNNLGLSYTELGRLQDAKRLYDEALAIAIGNGNKSGEAIVLNNLCEIAQRENKIDLLKYYADRALRLNTELADSGGIMGSKLALSVYFLNNKDFVKAQNLALEVLDIAGKQNLLEGKALALGMLSNIAFAAGDIRKGFDFYYQRAKVESAVFSESLKQKEAGMRIKYETEKKESLIKQLEAEKKVQQLSIRQKSILNYILFGSAATLLLISLLSYRNYKQKQKLQQHRISELETQQQLTATEAVLKGEEQERTRLAKDLHDGLGGMLSGIKYSFNTMKGNLIMTPDNARAFERSMDMLDSSIKEMRRVAHNMMPEALVKFGLDTALKDFCNDINQTGALSVTYQSIGLEGNEINQTTSITIYRIVQELINNTMKHAAAKHAIVQVTKSEHQLTVTVEDDGRGFDTSIIKGTDGIGWTNIQNRLDFLKGKLDINSEPGKGTSVLIELNV